MSNSFRTTNYRSAHAAYENRRRRLIAYGRWQPFVDAEPVRQHIRSLMGAGVSRRRIPELAGVPDATIGRVLYGSAQKAPSKQIRAEAAERILRVRLTEEALSPRVLVDATGTHRRLQALIALGWSRGKLAEQFEVERNTIGRCMARARVYSATAAAVRNLYDRLWDVPPPEATRWDVSAAVASRREAARKGWPPPLAWDDETIDDPAAKPHHAAPVHLDEVAIERALGGGQVRLTRAEAAEVARIGTERGMTAREIADATGRTQRSVVRYRAEIAA